ncbi:MAG: hypothetical protein ACJ8AW_07135 [Rhodopila sp.]|jgi:hypothetical protein
MAVNTRDNRADRRQVDVVIGVDGRLLSRPERMRAMRTGIEGRCDDVIWVFGQDAGNARTAATALAGLIGRLGFAPREDGVLELSGILGGTFSRACNAATGAVSASI